MPLNHTSEIINIGYFVSFKLQEQAVQHPKTQSSTEAGRSPPSAASTFTAMGTPQGGWASEPSEGGQR